MIRLARKEDIEGINKLLYQVHNVHADIRPDIFIKDLKKYTNDELLNIINNSSSTPIYVNEINNKIAGYAFLVYKKEYSNSTYPIKSIYIDDLCVDESIRHKHVGKDLCEYVFKIAKDNDFDKVTLNVWQGNDTALKFYEYMGFKPLKTTMELKIK